jgi:transcriptional regulator
LYLPAQFNESRVEVLHALMRRHPLATVVALSGEGFAANHLPLEVAGEPAPLGLLRGHIARANPLWKEYREASEALAIFQGPQSYISPSLYPSKQETGEVVPTWNYAVVHARGTLRFFQAAEWLRHFVANLTDHHEVARAQPWKIDDAPDRYIDQNLKLIVGFELTITSLRGKFKLSQNRTSADWQGVLSSLQQAGDVNSREMADMMANANANANANADAAVGDGAGPAPDR